MEFLGRPARTGLTAAEFALRSDALLVPFFGIRQPDGLGFSVEIDAPIETADAESMMEAFNMKLTQGRLA